MAMQSLDESLERIRDADGSLTFLPTDKRQSKGRSVGSSRDQTCFICRKYQAKQELTQWKCKDCGMPLCKHSRADKPGRDMTCLAERQASDCPILGCNLVARARFIMPDHMKVYSS
jgi:hypothetical protein